MSALELKREARTLLTQLTEFATAPQALAAIFESFDEDPTRAHVLQLLLEWQSLAQGSRALSDVIARFECEQDDDNDRVHGDSTSNAVSDDTATSSSSYNECDWLLLVMGKPALLFATSIYDEDLALLVWRGLVRFQQQLQLPPLQMQQQRRHLARQALDNVFDSHGYCALHYAVEAQMHALLVCVAQDLNADDAALPMPLPQLCLRVVTQDVMLPMGKHQIQGKNIASGGCTLLHLAAKNGALALVELLVTSPFGLHAALSSSDWDGHTPLQLALLHGRDDVAAFLRTLDMSTSEPLANLSTDELAALRIARDARAKSRYIASLDPPPSMQQTATFAQLWTIHECTLVAAALERAAATTGWCTQRHAAYPTTDLPCYRVVPLESWVRGALARRLFPLLHNQYAISTTNYRIAFRELFFVKYEAANGERAELALHCDGSALSFNVLLNAPSDFDGGGTYFAATRATVHIEQGDVVAHSGKVQHAGAPVLRGKRLILVGFLDVVSRVF